MKLLHTSDLHIGKRVNEFPMIEDQEYILNQILQIVDEQQPDGILIAGDVYDKNIPTVEGVALFDSFLTELFCRKLATFIVSGNHDSCERLNFGGRIMEKNKIYIVGTYEGKMEPFTLMDEEGEVRVYLLPFVKPALVNRYHPGVSTYHEAVETIIKHCEIDTKQRNVLVAHQFITSGETTPEQCDSENISVGGLDNIDAAVFEPFDYVALGHLHGAQSIGRDTVRYAGSPLKYSFSEAKQVKSVTLLTLGKKGSVQYEKLSLKPLKDMREIKGPIEALTDVKVYSQENTMDYLRVTLTDEGDIYDAIGKLRSVYPNLMRLDFENRKTVWNSEAQTAAHELEKKDPLELFEEFYQSQNNITINEIQKSIMNQLFEEMEVGKN